MSIMTKKLTVEKQTKTNTKVPVSIILTSLSFSGWAAPTIDLRYMNAIRKSDTADKDHKK